MSGGGGLTVVAFDPGVTTGWAVVSDGTVVGSGEVGPVGGDGHAETLKAERKAATLLWDSVDKVLKGGWIDIVAYEDFILRGKTQARHGLAPVRMTSALVAAAVPYTSAPIVLVGPGDAKGVMPNERLKNLGLYVSGKHARDAVRVAVVAERRG